MKWYKKVGAGILVILFAPVLIVVFLLFLMFRPFIEKKEKTEYVHSEYFKNFGVPYYFCITSSPEYTIYKSAKDKNIEIEYVRKENGLEYFIHDENLYIFPEFDEVEFSEEKSVWEVMCGEEYIPLDEMYQRCLEGLGNVPQNVQVKLLVQKDMIIQVNELHALPEYIHQVIDYKDMF